MARDGSKESDSTDDVGNGEPTPWNAKQEAIATLLVTGRSVREIASETGVGARTIHRWLNNDDYRVYIASLRRQVLSEALGRLTDACVSAARTLHVLMRDVERSQIRLHAAKAILESVVAFQKHVDFDERLARLEALAHESRRPFESD
jgi:transposase-like protein